MVAPAGEQRGLVDQVGQVGADHSGRRGSDRGEVDVDCQRHVPVCTSSICWRPLRSAGWTVTRRSNLPGRSRARSSTSGRFVVPMTVTLVEESNPSISVRIWLRVCSRSSLPPLKPAIGGSAGAAHGVDPATPPARRRRGKRGELSNPEISARPFFSPRNGRAGSAHDCPQLRHQLPIRAACCVARRGQASSAQA